MDLKGPSGRCQPCSWLQSHCALYWQLDFRHCFRLTVKNKPSKLRLLNSHMKAALVGKGSLTNKTASLRSRSHCWAGIPTVQQGQERQADFQHSGAVWYFLATAEGVQWERTHCSVSRAQQFSKASEWARGQPFPWLLSWKSEVFLPIFSPDVLEAG